MTKVRRKLFLAILDVAELAKKLGDMEAYNRILLFSCQLDGDQCEHGRSHLGTCAECDNSPEWKDKVMEMVKQWLFSPL